MSGTRDCGGAEDSAGAEGERRPRATGSGEIAHPQSQATGRGEGGQFLARAPEETQRSAPPKLMPFKGIFKLLHGIEVKFMDLPSLFQCGIPPGKENRVALVRAGQRSPMWLGCSSCPSFQTEFLLIVEGQPSDLCQRSMCACPPGDFPSCPCGC